MILGKELIHALPCASIKCFFEKISILKQKKGEFLNTKKTIGTQSGCLSIEYQGCQSILQSFDVEFIQSPLLYVVGIFNCGFSTKVHLTRNVH